MPYHREVIRRVDPLFRVRAELLKVLTQASLCDPQTPRARSPTEGARFASARVAAAAIPAETSASGGVGSLRCSARRSAIRPGPFHHPPDGRARARRSRRIMESSGGRNDCGQAPRPPAYHGAIGAGVRAAHRDGRLVWQLADAAEFLFGWRPLRVTRDTS
jgi:hypothetical protein